MKQSYSSFYIILSRSDRTPSNLQLASLAASLVTLVKHQIVLHLSHTLPLMDKLSKAFVLFPVFLTCAIFKLGSIAVICAVMRLQLVIPVYIATHLLLLGICWCAGKKNLIDGAGVHTYRLAILVTTKGGSYLTRKESIETFVYNTIFWFVCPHHRALTSIGWKRPQLTPVWDSKRGEEDKRDMLS